MVDVREYKLDKPEAWYANRYAVNRYSIIIKLCKSDNNKYVARIIDLYNKKITVVEDVDKNMLTKTILEIINEPLDDFVMYAGFVNVIAVKECEEYECQPIFLPDDIPSCIERMLRVLDS